jgi:hypothetical protein
VPVSCPPFHVAARLDEGDRVIIGDGPAAGMVGELVSIDFDTDLAQVRVMVPVPWGVRPGTAVVTARALRPARPRLDELVEPVTMPRRGRPRIISEETVEKIERLYETGIYSHADIAGIVGVSKSSVTSYLKRRNT